MPDNEAPENSVTEEDGMSVVERWTPDEGQEVWMNHPDGRRLGVVVGTVPDAHPHRGGQPIIQRDDGQRFAIHPMFLLPFEYGGEEWQRANADGRVRDALITGPTTTPPRRTA